MSSTVSIIVPAYKAEKYLDQCLGSIHFQTYKDIQLIVIKDIEGVSKARNAGLEQATGEFITFVDADDHLEPDAIKNLVDAIDGVDMVVGSFRKFGGMTNTVTNRNETFSRPTLAAYVMNNLRFPGGSQMLSGCWAKLFRKSITDGLWFPEELDTAEDMVFNFAYLCGCKTVRLISQVVYNNRKHFDSLSTKFDRRDPFGLFGAVKGLEMVREYLKGSFSEDEIDKAIDNSTAYHMLLSSLRIACQVKGYDTKVIHETMSRVYG